MLKVHPPEHGFGVAEVLGVRPDAGEADAAILRETLAAHGVVCLRFEQALEDAELQAVVRLFGEIKDPVGRTKDGAEMRYGAARQIIDSGFVMTDEVREKLGDLQFGGLDDERPGLFETFHCDDTYTERPASATVLHARELPPSGGGPTCFMDMRASLALLDAAMQERLAPLRVVYAYDNEDAFPPRRSAQGPHSVLEEVSHPLVRTHAFTGGLSLFHDLDRAKHIEGMSVAEGRALLRELQDHAESKAPRCEHAWRDHDVLAWDNASVQHKAGGNFKVGEPRRFWRYMVSGERPD